MKVLVTAASRHGSTVDVAAAIARVLRLRGLETEELAPVDVRDVSAYDAVVLGSGVYAGRWLSPATGLVQRLAPQLAQRPVWLFSSGPVGEPPTPTEEPDVAAAMTATGARQHRVFPGRIEHAGLNLLERAMVRVVHAPEGDYRDWAAVTAWATEIAESLAPTRQ